MKYSYFNSYHLENFSLYNLSRFYSVMYLNQLPAADLNYVVVVGKLCPQLVPFHGDGCLVMVRINPIHRSYNRMIFFKKKTNKKKHII